jgi:hypothetical protein
MSAQKGPRPIANMVIVLLVALALAGAAYSVYEMASYLLARTS